ncbi:MAG: hypothetical protein L0229_16095, partial [Blastocatellia bacterium]|nr:hypothetical protein [Blastocatellia bacterium]
RGKMKVFPERNAYLECADHGGALDSAKVRQKLRLHAAEADGILLLLPSSFRQKLRLHAAEADGIFVHNCHSMPRAV